MKRTTLLAVLFAGLSTVFFADTSYAQNRCGSNGSFNNLEAVGLTADNRLVCFREQGGGGVRNIGTITGLAAGDTLVGIDFRPADGLLYGVGVPSSTVYQFAAGQTGNIVATPLPALTNMADMTPVALTGVQFGVDFNPVPDRLRITSDTGQNLRINVVTGVTNVDGGINNGMMVAQTGVAAAAYTNNDSSAQTVTVLHTLDTDALVDAAATPPVFDQLFIQVPPNAGNQNAVGALTLGGVAVDSGNGSTFDIFSLTQPTVGPMGVAQTATIATRGLAVFTPTGSANSVLYSVSLATGTLTVRRNFGANNQIVGIAIPLLQGN